MNRTQLKYIAAIAMVVDHIGLFFIPASSPFYPLCRLIGRLTAPVMCFFLAEGYRYTSSKNKYAARLFLFAFISQFAYAYSRYKTLNAFDFNMIFTLFLSFAVLLAYENIRQPFLKWLAIVALIALSSPCDWGIFAPLWTLFFYLFKENRKKQLISYSAISLVVCISAALFHLIGDGIWYAEWWQIGLFLFIPLCLTYNGKSGSRKPFHKWFFYFLYPLHLLLFGMISSL